MTANLLLTSPAKASSSQTTPMDYTIPRGAHAVPSNLLDTRSDAEVDATLLAPPPVTSEKNIWFFWHSGYQTMPPYTRRNVQAWHRRFSKQGWTVRVVNRLPSDPLNISTFLPVDDPNTFPQAFRDGTLAGNYAPQHTSDLVRWPLLLKYGGVYADAGLLQIGNLDRLWNETVGNPESNYEVASFNMGDGKERALTNYFFCARRNNPLFQRCHRLFLKVWEGRTDTEGSWAHPLLKGVPLIGANDGHTFTENGKTYGPEECAQILTDYILQGQVSTLVMGLVDEEDGWNGPEYVREHVYAMDFMVGSQLINDLTAWNSKRQFELMGLRLPNKDEAETDDQKAARRIVEECLTKSFSFKLATGLIVRFFGPTLSSYWKQNVGSDDVPGTYAHWLRYGIANWEPEELLPPIEWVDIEPYKKGPLLREK